MNEEKALVHQQQQSPAVLHRISTDVAGVCKEIVLKTSLSIQGRKYVRVEGWEAIATAHGCFAGAEDAQAVYDPATQEVIGWKAKGILRNSNGQTIATAEGFVGIDEVDREGKPTWGSRPMYACLAMAQTRAISRVCRSAFAHVVVLMDARLSTTPAEEVPAGGFVDVDAEPVPEPQGGGDDVPYDEPQKASGDEEWRSYPIPYGKWKGKPMGEVPQRPLWGFWKNHTVEDQNGEFSPKNAEFRAMLDEAGKHYNFK